MVFCVVILYPLVTDQGILWVWCQPHHSTPPPPPPPLRLCLVPHTATLRWCFMTPSLWPILLVPSVQPAPLPLLPSHETFVRKHSTGQVSSWISLRFYINMIWNKISRVLKMGVYLIWYTHNFPRYNLSDFGFFEFRFQGTDFKLCKARALSRLFFLFLWNYMMFNLWEICIIWFAKCSTGQKTRIIFENLLERHAGLLLAYIY